MRMSLRIRSSAGKKGQPLPDAGEPTLAMWESHDFDALFEGRGPSDRLMYRLGIMRGHGPSIGRRSIIVIAITWLPMIVFAAWAGRAIGSTPRMSMLLDFSNYARLFIAIPLLFATEGVTGPRIRAAVLYFLEAGLVASSDRPAFLAAAIRAKRRRESTSAEAFILGFALLGTWFLSIDQLGGEPVMTWHSIWGPAHRHLILVGIWFNFVAVPLVLFFFFLWLWWIAIWTIFLHDAACLQLNLLPTHADLVGGLGFLAPIHFSFAMLSFAMSCVISANVAFRITFQGLDVTGLRTMIVPLIAYVVIAEMVIFGPLLVFVPRLIRAKLNGLMTYGNLTQRHNQLFHDKWTSSTEPEQRSPLGDPDMSSLVDLGSSYQVVQQMGILPVNTRQIIGVAVITCLPGLPLVFLVVPLPEMIRFFVTAIV